MACQQKTFEQDPPSVLRFRASDEQTSARGHTSLPKIGHMESLHYPIAS